MGSKASPIYEDLDVHTEWVHEAADDTLIAYLPGFKKEQIKVQVTSAGKLRISGQRPIGDNKFARFWKEIPIPSNCDQNKIRANFKGGMLHIKYPKLIVPAENQAEEQEAKPSAQVPKSDQKPADASLPQKQKNGPEQAPPKTAMEKETGHEKKADEDVSSTNNKASATNELSDEKGMEKEEKGSSDQQGKATSKEMDDSAGNENIESKKVDGVNKYYQLGMNYKQIVEGLVKELKNPRKMVNSVLVVLLVVVLAVYVRNAIRSFTLRND